MTAGADEEAEIGGLGAELKVWTRKAKKTRQKMIFFTTHSSMGNNQEHESWEDRRGRKFAPAKILPGLLKVIKDRGACQSKRRLSLRLRRDEMPDEIVDI